jgi:hypothetical protein
MVCHIFPAYRAGLATVYGDDRGEPGMVEGEGGIMKYLFIAGFGLVMLAALWLNDDIRNNLGIAPEPERQCTAVDINLQPVVSFDDYPGLYILDVTITFSDATVQKTRMYSNDRENWSSDSDDAFKPLIIPEEDDLEEFEILPEENKWKGV